MNIFDFHGHTKYSQFPEGVNYSPEDAIKKAAAIGLSGIAITGHNTFEGLQQVADLSEKHNLIVVPGVEISARVGHRAPHILGLGIDPKLVHSRLPVLRDPLTVIKWIHDNGGIAIAPHPKQVQTLTALSYSELQSILGEQNRFDGIEVATLQGYNETVARIADKYKVSAVGSSDFHMLAQVGVVVTDVFTDTSSWQEVIKAIQERRCVPLTTARIGSAPRKRTPGILLQQFMGRQL